MIAKCAPSIVSVEAPVDGQCSKARRDARWSVWMLATVTAPATHGSRVPQLRNRAERPPSRQVVFDFRPREFLGSQKQR
jgi:hypothetical protein